MQTDRRVVMLDIKKIIFALLALLFCTSFVFAQSPLLDGLVVYYKMDETSGTNAQDYFNLRNGTANTADVFTSERAGIINTGADFTGGENYISFGTYTSTTDITISAWVNATNFAQTNVIFSNDETNTVPRGFQFRTDQVFTGNIGVTINQAGFTNNQWAHIVMVKTGNNNLKVYVNGVERATSTNAQFNTTSKDALIGARSLFSLAENMNGIIDELGIWNRSLSEQEVIDLYDLQKEGFISGQPPFQEDGNFTITATNFITSANIDEFNATINSTLYTTTNGSIVTPFMTNESILSNIDVIASGFYTRTFNNFNTSTNLNAALTPDTFAFVNFTGLRIYTDILIPSFNVTVNTTTQLNTDTFLIPKNTIINAQFTNGGYFTRNRTFNVQDEDEQTFNFNMLYNTVTNLTARNNLTLNPISDFEVQLNKTTLNLTTTTGLIQFNHSKIYMSTLSINDFVYLGSNEYEFIYYTELLNVSVATPPLIPLPFSPVFFPDGCIQQSPLRLQIINDDMSCFNYQTSSFIFVSGVESLSQYRLYYNLDNASITYTGDTYITENYDNVNLSQNFTATLFSTNTINISFVDEITLEPTLNVTFDIVGEFFSQRYITTNGTLLLEGIGDGTYEIRYSLNDTERRPRSYYFTVPIEKIDAQLQLKTIFENVSQLFVRRVVDNNAQALENHIYELQRYYTETSTWQTVERALISTNGEAVFSGVPNTQAYRYRILNPQFQIIETSNAFFLIDDNAEIRVNIEPTAFESYNVFRKIESNLYLSSNNNFILEFIDNSNTVQEVCLTVSYSFQLNTTIQETCLQQNTGTISIPIDPNATGTYSAVATAQFLDGVFIINRDNYKLNQINAIAVLGVISFILFLIGVATAAVFSFVQPMAGMVFLMLLFIGFTPMIMGLIEVSLVATTTITFIGILILVIYFRFR